MKVGSAAIGGRIALADRCRDFVELTKPRIAILVLAAVTVGAFAGSGGQFPGAVLAHVVIGTALIAGGSSVFNHWLERDIDARMPRTRRRPLPSGRVAPGEALVFGWILSIAGAMQLYFFTPTITFGLGVLSWALYAFVYTPMKRWTVWNTVVGAIPGALPPVLGWSATRGEIGVGGVALFLILFVWQFPHFLAIAWLYRDDYRLGGLKMLPTTDLGMRLTGPEVVSGCLALAPISLAPTMLGIAGEVYFGGALVLSLQFLGYGVAFALRPCNERARWLLWASLIYLPAVLALLALNIQSH